MNGLKYQVDTFRMRISIFLTKIQQWTTKWPIGSTKWWTTVDFSFWKWKKEHNILKILGNGSLNFQHFQFYCVLKRESSQMTTLQSLSVNHLTLSCTIHAAIVKYKIRQKLCENNGIENSLCSWFARISTIWQFHRRSFNNFYLYVQIGKQTWNMKDKLEASMRLNNELPIPNI